MRRRRKLDVMLSKLPYLHNIFKSLDACGYEPGHYYSPIPDLEEVAKRRDAIFHKDAEKVKGINFEKSRQFELLKNIAQFYKDIPYDFEGQKTTNTRYQVPGAWYRYSDVIMLYGIMRHYNPKLVIEVGSGFSSAVMIDTNELFLNSNADMIFIDPFPDRLNKLLKPEDHKKYKILPSFVQDVNLDTFRALKENDILFIDSSHVSKVGSDLNFILFEILPVLNPGVLIHFHDIYFPFEMPAHWVMQKKWFWNENYLMRAYLTGTNKYSIINFNSYLQQEFKDWFKQNMPHCLTGDSDTGCIWLQKN